MRLLLPPLLRAHEEGVEAKAKAKLLFRLRLLLAEAREKLEAAVRLLLVEVHAAELQEGVVAAGNELVSIEH